MVWFEISTQSGRSLLTVNHYAPHPANKPNVISKYFCTLEKNLDTNIHRIPLIGYFNAANFNWLSGLPYQIVIFIQN